MSSGYRVEIKRSAQRELAALPRYVQQRIAAALAALAENPRSSGAAALRGYPGLYRVRVAGDYRVVYRVDDTTRTVLVRVIGHRRDVYRGL